MSEITTPQGQKVLSANEALVKRACASLAWSSCGEVVSGEEARQAGLIRELAKALAETHDLVANAYPALIAERDALRAMLREMTDAAEFDFCGESTDDCTDDESVAMDDGSAFTFGMIRRAKALLSSCPATGEGY